MNRTLPTRRPITAAPTIEQEFEDQAILSTASQVWPEGRKDDAGKLPYHLLAPEFLEATAAVLDFGAKKYTIKVENEWHRLLLAQNVTSAQVVIPSGAVVHVMKSNSGQPILTLLNGSAETKKIGLCEIPKELKSWQSAEKMIQNYVQETSTLNGLPLCENTGLPKIDIQSYVSQDALFVERLNTYTLIIVTKQENLEVFFAPDAIMDSDFWMTTWKGLSERFGILRPVSQTGERNWELGMSWSRPFAALMRHMWAWWRGEAADPETGMSHLHHACCCLMFLVAFESRHAGQDDRP